MTQTRKPAILSEAGAHADWIARPFLEAGYTLDTCSLAEVPGKMATGGYNVLILGRWYTQRKTKQEEEALVVGVLETVRQHLAAGGGVFFTLPIGGVLAFDRLIGPYGADICNLAIDQPDNVIINDMDVHRFRNAYTTNISPLVSDGVEGVWYPEMMSSCMATRPVLTSGPEWFPLLAAMPNAGIESKHVGTGNSVAVPADALPDFGPSIPIIAARQVGEGRLAVCGIPSGFHLDSPHNYPDARHFLFEGFNGTPSGLQRLLVNTMGWLGAPSLAAGNLGGAPSGQYVLEPNVPRYPDDPPVIWADRHFPPDDPHPLTGLVGARTAYSCGEGTVAEYVEAAKAAGLDYLVFLEEYASLTAEKLEALKADCQALSTDTFFAVPGYTIDDLAGAHFFCYGYEIHCPPPEICSTDGKMLSNDNPDGTVRTSTYEGVHFVHTFETLNLRARRGRYNHGTSPTLFLDQRTSDSCALVTWHDGQVIDDVRDRFHELEDRAMRVIPVALTLMDRPADVQRALAAGWVTMVIEPYATLTDKVLRKYMAPELEWWGMIDEERANIARFRFDNWQYGPPFQYITNGPVVRAWTASVSSRDPEWRAPDTEIPPTADLFRLDVTGFRLRIKVTSDKGLDEVRLYDGIRVIRRWQCGGAADFEQELDLTHHQQLHLSLEATDVAGGTAICGTYCTLRLDWCGFYCADRNNPLCIGFEKDERGLAYGWSGTIYLTYNNFQWGGTSCYLGRWFYYGDGMTPVAKNPLDDEIVPSDGGVRNAGATLHIFTRLPKLDPPERGLVIVPQQQLISPDVTVDTFVVNCGFDPEWTGFRGRERTGFGLFPVHPSRYMDIQRTMTVFRPRPYALTTLVNEYEIRFKEDPGITEPLNIGWFDAVPHVLFRRDGSQVALAGDDEQPFNLPWRHGEYVVSWTDGCRPAIFINDGPDLELTRQLDPATKAIGPTEVQYGRVIVLLPVEQFPQRGEPARLRFLAIGGTSDTTDPDVGEAMRRAMGLAGTTAYAVELERGELLSQRLLLTLDGQGEGVACRIPRAELPMALPILVRHLNANWPVYLVDRAGNRCRPLGVYQDTAYATLDTLAGDWSLFIGHPVTASHREVVLSLTQISPEAWTLEAHNPTVAALTVDLAVSPYFTALAWSGDTISLPAGTSVVLELQNAGVAV
jgi:hypothetical protein